VWLNEKNAWVQPLLRAAEGRLAALATRASRPGGPAPLEARALRQAARELLLAQASDWPFILHTGTSPEYARGRVAGHLERLGTLCGRIESGTVDAGELAAIEALDPIFPELDWRHWSESL
jgi:1,4-alpha-glucan branching enzyme